MGEWKDDLPRKHIPVFVFPFWLLLMYPIADGQGKMVYPGGHTYSGSWKAGRRSGKVSIYPIPLIFGENRVPY